MIKILNKVDAGEGKLSEIHLDKQIYLLNKILLFG